MQVSRLNRSRIETARLSRWGRAVRKQWGDVRWVRTALLTLNVWGLPARGPETVCEWRMKPGALLYGQVRARGAAQESPIVGPMPWG